MTKESRGYGLFYWTRAVINTPRLFYDADYPNDTIDDEFQDELTYEKWVDTKIASQELCEWE